MPTLNRAREVWFVVTTDEKARAVRLALSGAGVVQVPAAGPKGLQRTIWFLDRAAASQLPSGLNRIASP
jgi:6-phosphogluconolactonase